MNFIDVETPVLGPQHAGRGRDYLVPSRVSQGSFYALPQSPQLYKQILMMAGYDRYVQVARCFRDEDLRADRQPEFTQLDLEMSFVDADDVIGVIDGLVQKIAKQELGLDVKLPLPRMTYDEAMERFGHDAPDLRFGLELVDCTDLAAKSDFRVFSSVAASGGRVRAINAKKGGEHYSRRGIDALTEYVGGVRREGPGVVQSRSRRHAAVDDRQEFHAGAAQGNRHAAEGRAGRLAAVRGRPVEGHVQGALRAAAEDRRGDEAVRSEDDALFLGRRVPDVRLRRRGKTLGGDASSVHVAARSGFCDCSSPTRASAGRRRTTS